MTSDIIYVCHSVNNKNVRRGELKILRNREEELYFEFGEIETNIKKRFYNDKETLRKDFAALQKLKAEEEKEKENKVEEDKMQENKVEVKEEVKEEVKSIEEKTEKEKPEVQKESKKKYNL